MKPLPILFVLVIFGTACNNSHPVNKKLVGEWQSKADSSTLKITDKQFILDSPEPEDYFVKGDTIFTSFEGNLPYTKYVIIKLDDHHLQLFTPDSATVEYSR